MMISATEWHSRSQGRCPNPFCSCDPCQCVGSCACGVTTLGELEERIMRQLWQTPDNEVTIRDVAESLPDHAYTTVATVMDRLVVKGLLRSTRIRRVKRYRTIGTSSSHTAIVMHQALAAAEDPHETMRRFAGSLSPNEADILRSALG